MSALDVRGLEAGYAGASVIRDISLTVERGEIVAVLGRNGVGKSTLVATIAGTLSATRGSVLLGDIDATTKQPSRRHAMGLRVVLQERPIFADLTVGENLRLEGVGQSHASRSPFAFLGHRTQQLAGTLSGGEQKMLAISRALAAGGSVCVFDEPTEGLQPANVDLFSESLRSAAQAGRAVLLVEQHLDMAMSVANRWYLLEKGAVHEHGEVRAGTTEHIAELMHL